MLDFFNDRSVGEVLYAYSQSMSLDITIRSRNLDRSVASILLNTNLPLAASWRRLGRTWPVRCHSW